MIVVSDSAPLIALSAIGLFDLLRTLYHAIAIPDEVYHEIVSKGGGRTGASEVSAAVWINRHTITNQYDAVVQLIATTGLQRGESEAIILAQELNAARIILDDLPARRYAIAHKLPVIGTVGILLLAKEQNLIPSVKQPMDALITAGGRIHPTLYDSTLRSAGE